MDDTSLSDPDGNDSEQDYRMPSYITRMGESISLGPDLKKFSFHRHRFLSQGGKDSSSC
jgi:hypothetical protein